MNGIIVREDSAESFLARRELWKHQICQPLRGIEDVHTFIDLGCNRGIWTCWLASRVANPQHLKGLLVDANPDAAEIATAALKRNEMSSCAVLTGAVGCGPQPYVRFAEAPNDLTRHVAETGVKTPTLNVVKVWKEMHGSDLVDVLKIDVEGAEQGLLDDEPELFLRTKRLIMETHPPHDPSKIAEQLSALEFDVYALNHWFEGSYMLFAERLTNSASLT